MLLFYAVSNLWGGLDVMYYYLLYLCTLLFCCSIYMFFTYLCLFVVFPLISIFLCACLVFLPFFVVCRVCAAICWLFRVVF
jgi:hypothetical protein